MGATPRIPRGLRGRQAQTPLDKAFEATEEAVLAGLTTEQREALGPDFADIVPTPPPAESEPELSPSPAPEAAPEPPPVAAPEPPPEPAPAPAPAVAAPVVASPEPAPIAAPAEEEPKPSGAVYAELRKLRRQLREAQEREATAQPPAPQPAAQPQAPTPPPAEDDDPLGIKATVSSAVAEQINPLKEENARLRAQMEQNSERIRLEAEETAFRTVHPEYNDAAQFLVSHVRTEFEQSGMAAYRGNQILNAARSGNKAVKDLVENYADEHNVSEEDAARALAVGQYVNERYNELVQGARAMGKTVPQSVWDNAQHRGFRAVSAPSTAQGAAPVVTPAPAQPASRVEQSQRQNALGPSLGAMNGTGTPAPRGGGATPPKTRVEFQRLLQEGVVGEQEMARWDAQNPRWEEDMA